MKPFQNKERQRWNQPAAPAYKAHTGPGRSRAIEVHIEELVLHGFAASERHRLADAVEWELERLFAAQLLPARWHSDTQVERLDAGGFKVALGAPPSQIGENLAQAICAGLNPPADVELDESTR